jgi:hypothetical protein
MSRNIFKQIKALDILFAKILTGIHRGIYKDRAVSA